MEPLKITKQPEKDNSIPLENLKGIEDNWLKSFYEELEENALLDDNIAIPNDNSEDIVLLATEPIYKEAIASKDANKWRLACQKELQALKEKGTWSLVPRTPDLKVLDGRWVLKIKDPYRNPLYKARWITRSFQQ